MAEEKITQRVAAVLAADAVEYSRLMAADETATIATLDQARAVFREHVEAHQGRVVDTAGDSVLAVFETTGGAVRASIAIQKRLAEVNDPLPEDRRMLFRVGVHLGDIHEKSDGTIYGDGINVAARLQSLAIAGGIVVSGSVRESVRGRLGVRFEFLGEQEVKNIPEPVQAYRVLPEGEAAADAAVKARPRLAFIAAAIVAIGGIILWQATRPPEETELAEAPAAQSDDPILALPTGPSIAVLPFDNLSGNPDQEYFADGITENIITRLSQFSNLKVIGRNSTFQYKGQPADIRAVGRDLGAKYVLEGSVRRSENAVRITSQLLDGTDGAHLWAQTYDRDLTGGAIFAIEDDVTDQVIGAIANVYGVIARAELEDVGTKKAADLSAYDCVLFAQAYQGAASPESFERARACLEKTAERLPTYTDALAWLAFIYHDDVLFWSGWDDSKLDRALRLAREALALDPSSQRAKAVVALVYFAKRDCSGFIQAANDALNINPNNAEWLMEFSYRFRGCGDWDKATGMARKVIQLDPHPLPYVYGSLAASMYHDRNYDEALKFCRKAEILGFYWSYVQLAANYGQLGRTDEAQKAVEQLLKLNPAFPGQARSELEYWFFSQPEELDHWLDGLRKAGLEIADQASAAK